MKCFLMVVAFVTVYSFGTESSKKPDIGSLNGYTFESFLKDFGKSYDDSKEYNLRKTLFETRVAGFIEHNLGSSSYKLNVNKLADLSDAEIKQFKGYNKKIPRTPGSPAQSLEATSIADSIDWRTKGAITPVKDQGGCGSCWAFGSAETLESHTFLHGAGNLPILSPQQLVDCAPNPHHCGGTGGCEGSIPELAYAWVKGNGLASEADYPYQGQDGTCRNVSKPAATVTGFVNVPSNNYSAVMAALQIGPLAITVDAGPWTFYDSGVFTECQNMEPIDLDHVVQLVGYGTDSGKNYWLVRNSWGTSFGEEGYIRIERHLTGDFCGKDNTPKDGTGCTGGPASVKVCGSCGILYDAVYPTVPAKSQPTE